MDNDKKAVLTRYIVCFCVAIGIVIFVLAIKGFFIDIQVLCDAFTTAGLLLILFSGLLYVSGEGVFLGVGYAVGRAVKALIPFSRKEHETYAQYRERKLGKGKSKGDHAIFLTGLFFLAIGVIFLIIWYQV